MNRYMLADKMAIPEVDPFTVTAIELQTLLAKKRVSTVDLVELYLAQIEKVSGVSYIPEF